MTTPIRPLERADLPRVCELYEVAARSGAPEAPAGLAGYFARTLLDHPWVDPEIPSLVAQDADGTVIGLIGSHVRRLRVDRRLVRLAYSGQLVADPRHPGVGALLLRRFLRGPQDVTITDGATGRVHGMWTALGGQALAHASFGWTRVLRPGATARAVVERHPRPWLGRVTRLLGPPLDVAGTLVGRRIGMRPGEPAGTVEELTVGALLERIQSAAPHLRLHLDYDEPYLRWLFGELAAVDSFGVPVRRLVRHPDGREAGWFVYFRAVPGVSQVLQLAAPGGDPGLVLDHLLHDAARGGSAAVQGRVEPNLTAALHARNLPVSRSAWALVHTDDTAVLALLGSTRSLLTRLDGEWWMGHHVLWR